MVLALAGWAGWLHAGASSLYWYVRYAGGGDDDGLLLVGTLAAASEERARRIWHDQLISSRGVQPAPAWFLLKNRRAHLDCCFHLKQDESLKKKKKSSSCYIRDKDRQEDLRPPPQGCIQAEWWEDSIYAPRSATYPLLAGWLASYTPLVRGWLA